MEFRKPSEHQSSLFYLFFILIFIYLYNIIDGEGFQRQVYAKLFRKSKADRNFFSLGAI